MSSTSDTVAQNPVIDGAWYGKEIDQLQAKLAVEFPTVDEPTITAALELSTARLALPARIPNYLPVLVGRDARRQLVELTRPAIAS